MWAGAAGKSYPAKVKNVCHPCNLFPTKLDKGRGHAYRTGLVADAMQLRSERTAGYPRPINRMGTLEFQTLLIIDHIVEQEEIALKVKTSAAVMALAGLKTN